MSSKPMPVLYATTTEREMNFVTSPKLNSPGDELDRPDQQSQQNRQLQRVETQGGVTSNRRRRDQADRAGRAKDVMAGTEKKRADKSADDHRDDDRLRRQLEDQGKSDRLRDRNQGERRAGDEIGAELRAVVAFQLRQERQA